MKVVIVGVALFLSAVFCHAALIFADSFNYPDGAITNVADGIWKQHSGGGVCQVVSGQAQLMSTVGQDVDAALANQPYSTDSGAILYAGFTVKFTSLPTVGGTYFAHFNASSFHRCLVWSSTANAASGMFRLGIGNTSSANNSSGQIAVDLALNNTYFVVIRYDTASGVSTIWLNPTSESDASVTASDTPSPTSISNFSLRQNSGMGTVLLDDLRIGTSFSDVMFSGTPIAPVITTPPQSQVVAENDTVTFSVVASGTAPLSYQWTLNNTNILNATNDTFTLFNVTTNDSGGYSVIVTNTAGATNSEPATLVVNPLSSSFRYLTYNVKGNGVADWSTNTAQVQAIGRQLIYLHPDIVTFNEIPRTNIWQMANWVKAFMPGYFLATNSATDGYIRSTIASRWPITRSQSWLGSSNLANFGYTNGNGSFTRDLYEAEIAVPGFPQPLHVFVTHLKATTSDPQDDADRRGAEALCISNFFVNTFLAGTNRFHPYILSGDMNEDVNRPATNSYDTRQPIQRLTSLPTGLRLTTPVNPFDNSSSNDMTLSIQATRLTARFDYILPSTLLFSNITSSQVFRTDKLTPLPPTLNSNDDKTASDHLPVLMVFRNPYDKPFRILSVTRSNTAVSLNWESVPGQPYRVESSSNLLDWAPFGTNLVATNYHFTFTTNTSSELKYFRIYRGW